MAVAAKWFEVIGVTSIATLPTRENVYFLTFRSAAGIDEAESCKPRLLKSGSDKNSTGLGINANSEHMKSGPSSCFYR